jgi:hypothetical protein
MAEPRAAEPVLRRTVRHELANGSLEQFCRPVEQRKPLEDVGDRGGGGCRNAWNAAVEDVRGSAESRDADHA